MTRRGWYTSVVIALVTSAGLSASPCAGQSAASPRFQLSADTALIDERVGIALAGLSPGSTVTIRLDGLGPVTGWRGKATFRADDRGLVDLTRMAPTTGSYSGVHAMGLFWSAMPDSGAAPLLTGGTRAPNAEAPPPQPWRFVAELDGSVVATDTLWRRMVAPGVTLTPVRERGLVGTLYTPPDGGRHPAIIVLNGSQGGIATPNMFPGGLASRGFVVLSLGYFATDGLQPNLNRIPLEYFGTAISWLGQQASVDSARIGVLGQSRGAELALVLGATFPSLHAVVAYVPSHVAWPGTLGDSTRAAAWTIAGKPVPTIDHLESAAAVARYAGCPSAPTCSAPLTLHQFLALLDDSNAAARAEIPVERIRGGVFLLSGHEDGLWPSKLMAERIVARLRKHGFKYPVEHKSYAGAGHAIGRPYFSTPYVARARQHPITGRMVTQGGTPEGTALASEDSWPRVLAFLDAQLRSRR